MTVNIKPISVNNCWQGRRFKTAEYKSWANTLHMLLPSKLEALEAQIFVSLRWGFSSKGSDIDNPTKPTLDVLQQKYGFNDSTIYELHQKKMIVEKGKEFIDIAIFNDRKAFFDYIL